VMLDRGVEPLEGQKLLHMAQLCGLLRGAGHARNALSTIDFATPIRLATGRTLSPFLGRGSNESAVHPSNGEATAEQQHSPGE
jgi:hypothetical protein